MLWDTNHPFAGVARRWYEELQACVRSLDYQRARGIFADDTVSFGTYSALISGLDELEHNQWRNVWPTIRDFTIRLDDIRCQGGEVGLCIVAPWDSTGVRADGTTFDRPGRATILLVHQGDRWVAAHSHFSLYPTPSRSA